MYIVILTIRFIVRFSSVLKYFSQFHMRFQVVKYSRLLPASFDHISTDAVWMVYEKWFAPYQKQTSNDRDSLVPSCLSLQLTRTGIFNSLHHVTYWSLTFDLTVRSWNMVDYRYVVNHLSTRSHRPRICIFIDLLELSYANACYLDDCPRLASTP